MQRFGTAVPLGSGSSAEVFQAFDSLLQQDVALKFLRRDEPRLVARMFREAQAQSKIDHPGICRIYDTGHLDDRPYISMQLIDGEELGAVAHELTLDAKLDLMIQIADAAHAAHGHGLIHRDLKPDNILVHRHDGRLRPVIVDFGLVFELEDADRLTQEGETLGTPAYMAPEQAAGRIRDLDVRTDVYGLGATFFALLTGEPPFPGRSTTELLIQALEHEPRRPGSLVGGLPPELDYILLQCLEKCPEDRYPSAAALAEDLRNLVAGRPCAARRHHRRRTLTRRLQGWRRLSPLTMLAIAASSMALLNVEQPAELTPQPTIDEKRFVKTSQDLDWMLRADQMSSRHDVSPVRERARQRIAELETELGESPVPSGAGHYAVGRAYAALHDDIPAQRHLEQAWQLGYREPEVGYFLGLVLGRQYEHALEQVRDVEDETVRDRFLGEARRRFKEPAQQYLQHGRDAEAVSVEYVEALIDLYEERFESALARLETVRRDHPWLYEVDLVRGKVLWRMADEEFRRSDLEAAIAGYETAEKALHRALESAASDPEIYPELCRLQSIRIEAELDWSVPPTEDGLEQHLELCEQGLEVAPRSPRILRYAALAHELTSRVLLDRSWDPERSKVAATRALELAEQTVRVAPDDSDSHQVAAQVRMTLGRLRQVLGEGDQLDELRRAAASLKRARETLDGPQGPLNLLSASNHQLIAAALSARWQPADQPLRQALERIDEELQTAPSSFTLHCFRGGVEYAFARDARRWARPFTNHLERAEQGFRRCLELNPKYHWALIGMSLVTNLRTDERCLTEASAADEYDEARRFISEVEELDPGFEGGLLYVTRVRLAEARCLMLHGRDISRPLGALKALHNESENRKLPQTALLGDMLNQFESKRILLEGGDRVALEQAVDRFLAKASEARPAGTPRPIPMETRLFEVDRLLWLLAAAHQLERPTEPLIAALDDHFVTLAESDQGRFVEVPQYRMLRTIFDVLRDGAPSAVSLQAGRQAMDRDEDRPAYLAVHAKLWSRLFDRWSVTSA